MGRRYFQVYGFDLRVCGPRTWPELTDDPVVLLQKMSGPQGCHLASANLRLFQLNTTVEYQWVVCVCISETNMHSLFLMKTICSNFITRESVG